MRSFSSLLLLSPTVLLPFFAYLLSACHGGEQGKVEPAPLDRNGLAEARRFKDSLMREEGSPLPESTRTGFPGLRYFPPNDSLAFTVTLARLGRPEPMEIAATGGELRKARRMGYLRFPVGGVECSLAAYELAEGPGVLFIPFRDETNGRETYEGGRYLEIPAGQGNAPVRLDFNLAYNPYCAYNDSYSCPRVPTENVLPVAIRAGEMTPPAGYSSAH